MNYFDKKNKLVCIHEINIRKRSETEFFTPNNTFLQSGLLKFRKSSSVDNHIHFNRFSIIRKTNEVLYILEGSAIINLFDKNKEALDSFTALSGDLVIFISGGHGLIFNEDTKILEVKQGPYLGNYDKKKI